MTALANLVRLGDLDLLLAEARGGAARLRKLGFELPGLLELEATRSRLAARIERRWMVPYERARQRYGRGIAVVRDRVCLGCFVTLPTAAARSRVASPAAPAVDGAGSGEALGSPGLCASCGRILYWR